MIGSLLEFLPLTMFLVTMRNLPSSYEDYWVFTYGMSAIAAILCIGFKLTRREFQNKILLGINCYVISGAVAITANQLWLLQFYSSLQSAAMLLWIMGTGCCALLFSNWFPDTLRHAKHLRLYEALMSLLTIGAFALAFSYPNDRLLSETIPFSSLFIAYYMLTSRLVPAQASK
ncbi:hypothetical protein [Halodesulfovibrio sp.]|jgi:hypothetical protein|uniref:hypothetical protein n=1 Tax=Halodesulfovibrio sp. TaxID=1912772 RepID=UPI0025E41B56|nr:hypothetical protein [Halodesulfovibrio sp.]MCT4534663.1 hypothetical protein [Halodesulfovibrio sp.]